MGQGHEFPDESISAFVDGQMKPEEAARVYARVACDEAFHRRVCELRMIRDLIRLAYLDLPTPARGRAVPPLKLRVLRGNR